MPTLLSLEALEADKRYVEKQLAEATSSPWGTARLMWQNRLKEITQRIEESARAKSNYATVALIFNGNPVIGSGDIRLDFTTEALDRYQEVVTLTLAMGADGEISTRGRIAGSQRAHLYIRDLVRGSMGFVLEELPDQYEMLASPLKNAVEDTTERISTLANAPDEEFEEELARTPPRLLAAVQKFATVLYSAGASTRIVGDERRVSLSIDEVGRLSRRLAEAEIAEEVWSIDGVLLGILPEARKFELKLPGDDEKTMKGSVSEDLTLKNTTDAAFKEQLLLQPVNAQVKTVRTIRGGRTIRERHMLEALEPIIASESDDLE